MFSCQEVHHVSLDCLRLLFFPFSQPLPGSTLFFASLHFLRCFCVAADIASRPLLKEQTAICILSCAFPFAVSRNLHYSTLYSHSPECIFLLSSNVLPSLSSQCSLADVTYRSLPPNMKKQLCMLSSALASFAWDLEAAPEIYTLGHTAKLTAARTMSVFKSMVKVSCY